MTDSSPDLAARQNQAPITDSPWFWCALFTVVGLSALMATGGRLGRRQSDIERKYQARAAVASGLDVETEGGGEKSVDAEALPEYSTPQKTVIPLWPLEIILGLVGVGSFYMLLRERMGPRSAATARSASAADGD